MSIPARAKAKKVSRHFVLWYPKRCELPGCEEEEGLRQCSTCRMVHYCCSEHQNANWDKHKRDCCVFKRLGMRALFYTDEQMLAAYPQTPPKKLANRFETNASECGLCGKAKEDVGIILTSCCGMPVCDTEGQYQMMSYSRDFCPRSHTRYTMCGNHGVEKACDTDVDWRDCTFCTMDVLVQSPGTANALWRGLNSYNYAPLLADTVPRNALCAHCLTCDTNFMSSMEGSTSSSKGTECTRCRPHL